jgi:tetratricopeptide (TPR) repeat protein
MGDIKFVVDTLRKPPDLIEPPEGSGVNAIARKALHLAKLDRTREATDLLPSALETVRGAWGSEPQRLAVALQAAAILNRRELAEELLMKLAPFRQLILLDGTVSRHIADALAFLDRGTEALDYYLQALTVAEQAAFRPELALIRAHLAELLLDHYPDEHDAAIEHLDFAIAEFRDMKMQPALERALGRRGLLKA